MNPLISVWRWTNLDGDTFKADAIFSIVSRVGLPLIALVKAAGSTAIELARSLSCHFLRRHMAFTLFAKSVFMVAKIATFDSKVKFFYNAC